MTDWRWPRSLPGDSRSPKSRQSRRYAPLLPRPTRHSGSYQTPVRQGQLRIHSLSCFYGHERDARPDDIEFSIVGPAVLVQVILSTVLAASQELWFLHLTRGETAERILFVRKESYFVRPVEGSANLTLTPEKSNNTLAKCSSYDEL